jgi:hypothetical protein
MAFYPISYHLVIILKIFIIIYFCDSYLYYCVQKIIFVILLCSFIALFLHIHQTKFRDIRYDNSFEMRSDECQCIDGNTDNYIIRLQTPWHHFDSNHWFHSKYNIFIF